MKKRKIEKRFRRKVTNGWICHFLFCENAVKIITVTREGEQKENSFRNANKIGHLRLMSHMVGNL